jgi:predicted nuclease with TOPRIM domain
MRKKWMPVAFIVAGLAMIAAAITQYIDRREREQRQQAMQEQTRQRQEAMQEQARQLQLQIDQLRDQLKNLREAK